MKPNSDEIHFLALESLIDKVIVMRASSEQNSTLLHKKWRFLTLKRMFLLTAIAAMLLSFLLSIEDLSLLYCNWSDVFRVHSSTAGRYDE